MLWGFAAYIFATWFLLTHRLDRFWLPLLPILAVLAGLGADWIRHSGLARPAVGLILAISLLSNLVYDSSILAGFNEWTGDLNVLRRDLPERLNRPLATLDARLPPDARVLLVGQASVFHLSASDRLQHGLQRGDDRGAGDRQGRGRPCGRRSATVQLTHIYVDWKEIQRHRQPGGYGFTEFVTRERFAGWVAAGTPGAAHRIRRGSGAVPRPLTDDGRQVAGYHGHRESIIGKGCHGGPGGRDRRRGLHRQSSG